MTPFDLWWWLRLLWEIGRSGARIVRQWHTLNQLQKKG